jgi:hypothetical protein
MGVEIRPEPTSEERQALLAVLSGLDGQLKPAAWWEAGIQEAAEEEREQTVFPSAESPNRTFGCF